MSACLYMYTDHVSVSLQEAFAKLTENFREQIHKDGHLAPSLRFKKETCLHNGPDDGFLHSHPLVKFASLPAWALCNSVTQGAPASVLRA